MPRSYVTLAEHPVDMVRLACTKCERRGQYHKTTPIERHGADAILVEVQLNLGGPKVTAGKSWICAKQHER
jgi:hypothetical protein